MVAGHCFLLVGKDIGTSYQRKESQSSSISKKKQKIYTSHGSQGQSRGH